MPLASDRAHHYTILNEYVYLQRSGRPFRCVFIMCIFSGRGIHQLTDVQKTEKLSWDIIKSDSWHEIVTDHLVLLAVVEGTMEKRIMTLVSGWRDRSLYVSSSDYDDGGSNPSHTTRQSKAWCLRSSFTVRTWSGNRTWGRSVAIYAGLGHPNTCCCWQRKIWKNRWRSEDLSSRLQTLFLIIRWQGDLWSLRHLIWRV